MNSFYNQPKYLQWLEAILLLIIGFYPAIIIIELAYDQAMFYLIFLLYIPVAQFTTTPFYRLTGIYTYYSPMLIGYMSNNIRLDLHSGGSFDYLFVIRNFKKGVAIRNRLLAYHLEGLLNIIKQIETGTIPQSVDVTGTSYFFNSRTLHKLGFDLQVPSLFYRINLFLNIIDLFWMYSLSKGKFSIPKVWFAKKASIQGGKLVDNKLMFEELYEKLILKTKVTS